MTKPSCRSAAPSSFRCSGRRRNPARPVKRRKLPVAATTKPGVMNGASGIVRL
jgi:hypothetical protein